MISRHTDVELEKFIDLLFANNNPFMSELAGLRLEIKKLNRKSQKVKETSSRWEECTISAEKRAEAADKKAESDKAVMQDKIDRLMTLVVQLRNGGELKAMTGRAEKMEKIVADLIAQSKTMRIQAYGSKSQGK